MRRFRLPAASACDGRGSGGHYVVMGCHRLVVIATAAAASALVVSCTGSSDRVRPSPHPSSSTSTSAVTVIVIHRRPRIDPYFGGYVDGPGLAARTQAVGCRTWLLKPPSAISNFTQVTYLRIAKARLGSAVAHLKQLQRDKYVSSIEIASYAAFTTAPSGAMTRAAAAQKLRVPRRSCSIG